MKRLILCCLMAAMTWAVNAATDNHEKGGKKPTELKTVVFVTDIDCHHCAQKIMNNVPVLGKGVEDVQVDVPTKEVTITYNDQKTNEANLIKGLAKLKVKATPKKAE